MEKEPYACQTADAVVKRCRKPYCAAHECGIVFGRASGYYSRFPCVGYPADIYGAAAEKSNITAASGASCNPDPCDRSAISGRKAPGEPAGPVIRLRSAK